MFKKASRLEGVWMGVNRVDLDTSVDSTELGLEKAGTWFRVYSYISHTRGQRPQVQSHRGKQLQFPHLPATDDNPKRRCEWMDS